MVEIAVPRAIPEIERQERQAEAFVLRDVAQLVTPHRGRRLDAGDDHVTEGDRAEAASSQNELCEATIANVEKTAVPTPRQSEREQTQNVPDRISVMPDEGSAESQGMVATASSIAASMQRPGRTVTLCARTSRHLVCAS